jgi:hypothetical protein
VKSEGARPSRIRTVLVIAGRVLLVWASLYIAGFGCTSLVFSSGQQWQVYVPSLVLAVVTMWLATRGLPLRRAKAVGAPPEANLKPDL